MNKSIVYIIYGVSGSGKTTIGKLLASDFKIPFYDADDFHPEDNVKKMSDGLPLDDDDRHPWLEKISLLVRDAHLNCGCVLACSALKKVYREKLQSIDPAFIKWIYLDGRFDLIISRLENRKGHFFKKELLTSQFDTLERSEQGIIVDIDKEAKEVLQEIKSKLHMKKSQLGLIGLGVMGKSLAKNLLSKNFSLSVFNRHIDNKEVDVAKNFVKAQQNQDNVLGFDDLQSFVDSLEQPRSVMVMVSAGKGIDAVIDALLPMLSEGDCIIDGGNSHYKATLKRSDKLAYRGIHFLGTGISGGEEGALKGPSIMPGGSKVGYEQSGLFLEAIAAKDANNAPCCRYIGPQGAGHYVKMVHNGIEYAEMQLIAEIYYLLRFYQKISPSQIADIFEVWKKDGLDSYLLSITIDILHKKDGDRFLIDLVLDKAKQKGTGGWSTNAALELGVSLSTISESVMARNLSGIKSERVEAAKAYALESESFSVHYKIILDDLKKAYQATRIINHHIAGNPYYQSSHRFSNVKRSLE